MLFVMENVTKSYDSVRVLYNVSMTVDSGQSSGLVGESGSGKTTFVNCALKLTRPDIGRIVYDGIDVVSAKGGELKRFRREVQLIFQDPYSCLNPRMTIEDLVSEGLIVHNLENTKAERRECVAEVVEMVGLDSADIDRYPRSFSGGQRQRIAIARAIAIKPRILVCDEPVSALDVSVQAQVINLLLDMQQRLDLGILFVAHDLAVVRHMCSFIVVLNQGEVVESGSRENIFVCPKESYTQALLAAVPVPDPKIAREKRRERRELQSPHFTEERF